MACGCIPITTALGGPREFCIDDYNSRLVDNMSAESIVDLILSLLSDQDKLLRMSSNCTSYISDKFSIVNSALSICSLLGDS